LPHGLLAFFGVPVVRWEGMSGRRGRRSFVSGGRMTRQLRRPRPLVKCPSIGHHVPDGPRPAAEDKLNKRLGKNRNLTQELRREADSIQAALDALKQGAKARLSHGVALDPLHAVYVAVQNFTSVFAERVSQFPEFRPYYKSAAKADDEYMPGGPPMSPLTGSYFTTWAFFDLRFGPDDETIGTCLLDVAGLLGMSTEMIEAIRLMSGTRMGIYEHVGSQGGRTLLRELITDDGFECYVPAGYPGKAGELWFVRLCPPIDPANDHVAFTTPYVLLDFGKADWTAYLSKSLIGLTAPEKRRRLGELLKYGRGPDYWNEFIFQAYHHHRPDAIFLTGLPDVPGSLPHAN
jgi:hypothetical protein